MFDITLSNEFVLGVEPGVTAVYGKFAVGEFSDMFIADLKTWDRKQYERQWKLAVARIVDGADVSALILSYVEPPLSLLVWLRPLYREGDKVYTQDHGICFDQSRDPFSTDRPWDFLPERKRINLQGERILEWVTNVESLREFLRKTE
jgi:hypothetical protein